MKKVELLAPAGSYESFLGAVHAGADAVYLGGAKFGARAYADNFTGEEVCEAIRYAHIYGRKVYLTLNTLIKTREFDEIYEYLLPFYEAGLDAVIIQDLGVLKAVEEYFPDLERHISTQMTITGGYGASLLKKMGVERIVPARELSLSEIREIKAKADIEIEAFIHGAICYCYSGQCLFSSLLGGRSGNRGRCAQPCRLPYRYENGRERYPLSLKDMCTIEKIPQLIEAGIDSFKIEGRMKSPAYAAGVTAIYRKYIDRYYADPNAKYSVLKEDLDHLRSLYIRSEISEGYYDRHNGKEMITLENPSYAGGDEALNKKIRETYLEGDYRLPVEGKAVLKKGLPAELTLIYGENIVTVQGETVQEAMKQPLTAEAVEKQLKKSGNTAFFIEKFTLQMEDHLFMPVKALNELRREAFLGLEKEIIRKGERKQKGMEVQPDVKTEAGVLHNPVFHVTVQTKAQCEAALCNGMERIYLASDLCEDSRWLEEMKKKKGKSQLYLAFPYIIRKSDDGFLKKMGKLLEEEIFDGVLVRNLEEIEWLKEMAYQKEVVSDANLYIWNPKAYEVIREYCDSSCIPYELNIHEIKELTELTSEGRFIMSVYGRIPMMITANCVVKTHRGCMHGYEKGFYKLTDRYGKVFPTYPDCTHCYNVIYNSLPLSLHQNLNKVKGAGIHSFKLDFTTENGEETERILRFFVNSLKGSEEKAPYEEYTKGHFKRGVM